MRYDTRDNTPDPPRKPIDWPRLMRTAQRLGFPVLRVAPDGTQHLLRTVDDLDTWPPQPPTTHADHHEENR